MMVKKKSFMAVIIILLLSLCLAGCEKNNEEAKARMEAMIGTNGQITGEYDKSLSTACYNGIFVGKEKNDVVAYKGIPYAKQPVGVLRWKAPQAVDAGNNVYEAYYFGKSALQSEWATELGSYYAKGEDCLNLNVWSSQKVTGNKTVMVFFHGGSYCYGGTSDPLYDGQNFVEAHPEIVLVTVEFRSGLMGYIDLSQVEGGEAYSESGNLGLLDMVCSLKWIQQNIAGFGGNPNNVTIFGESSGGGAVSLLPLIDGTEGLFNRVIAESGSVALTFSKEECQVYTKELLEKTGAKSMADLLKLSEADIMKLIDEIDRDSNFPERDGIILPEDLYAAYAEGEASDIDLLIGSNADEAKYWIREMEIEVPFLRGETTFTLGIPIMYQTDTQKFEEKDQQYLDQFMSLQGNDRIENLTEFYNEVIFRVPANDEAEKNAANGGKAFVYYWNYPSAIRNWGACHAVELAYVFNNLDEQIYTGNNIDKNLASTVQEMWINFAQTGNPSTKTIDWPEYSEKNRYSMVLDRECHVEKNLLEEQRKVIEPLLKYGLHGSLDDLDFSVPVVKLYIVIAIIILISVIGVTVYCVKKQKEAKKYRSL